MTCELLDGQVEKRWRKAFSIPPCRNIALHLNFLYTIADVVQQFKIEGKYLCQHETVEAMFWVEWHKQIVDFNLKKSFEYNQKIFSHILENNAQVEKLHMQQCQFDSQIACTS